MAQEQKHRHKKQRAQEETKEAVAHDTKATDDLLEEIDGILETNAEAFVKAYVQKGGE